MKRVAATSKAGRPGAPVNNIQPRMAPVKGLNTLDAITSMPEGYAVVMENWWPMQSAIRVRPGYKDLGYFGAGAGTGTGARTFKFGAVRGKIFALTESGAFDISSAVSGVTPSVAGLSAATTAVIATELTSLTNFATSGGEFLWVLTDGTSAANCAFYTDGTTWTAQGAFTLTGGGTIDPALFRSVHAFKRQLFFLEKNTSNFYYLPVDQLTGTISRFPLGGLLTKGGYLVSFTTWSLDAGSGPDDFSAFVSNNGQVIVYKGTDPSATATWSLVGVYDLDAPATRFCFTKYGGDVIYWGQHGPIPLSVALPSSYISLKMGFSDKVQPSFQDSYAAYGGSAGRFAVLHAEQNLLMYTIPRAVRALSLTQPLDQQSVQLAMNTMTGAWTKFTGWDLIASASIGGKLLGALGTGNIVILWQPGTSTGAVAPYTAVFQDAYSTFRTQRQKTPSAVKPSLLFTFYAQGKVEVGATIDYQRGNAWPIYAGGLPMSSSIEYPTYTPGMPAGPAGDYSYAEPAKLEWLGITTYPGYAISTHFSVDWSNTKNQTNLDGIQLSSYDISFEVGNQ